MFAISIYLAFLTHSLDRYIYIPLGGAKNTILNTLLVFTFVALWHDLSFRLLAWGWLISLFVIPELLANYIVPKSKVWAFSNSILPREVFSLRTLPALSSLGTPPPVSSLNSIAETSHHGSYA